MDRIGPVDCSLPAPKHPISEEFFLEYLELEKILKIRDHINNIPFTHPRTVRNNASKIRCCGSFGLVETAFHMSLAIDSFLHIKLSATLVISTGQLFSYNLHVHWETNNKGRGDYVNSHDQIIFRNRIYQN